MGLWDKMFGRGATVAAAVPNAMDKFNDLKNKYNGVLDTINHEGIQLTNFHVENDKLVIRGAANSQDAVNHVWDKIKAIDSSMSDIVVDISVQEAAATPTQTYTVQPGDSLWKISKKFYGDGDEYMRIYYANKDKIKDPDMIQVGWELAIPADDSAQAAGN
jgi:LysM repeat protein